MIPAISKKNMLYVVLPHLKALLRDVEKCKRDGDWTPDAVQNAGLIAFKDAISALDDYFISANKVKIHRDLITVGMEFCTRHEQWLNTSPASTTKTFHEYILRFSKGSLKAWRIWLVDSGK